MLKLSVFWFVFSYYLLTFFFSCDPVWPSSIENPRIYQYGMMMESSDPLEESRQYFEAL